MKYLPASAAFCANIGFAALVVFVFCILPLASCSPNHYKKSGFNKNGERKNPQEQDSLPAESGRSQSQPPQTPQHSPEGPGHTGGGDPDFPSREDVIKAVQKTKALLQSRQLYETILAATRLDWATTFPNKPNLHRNLIKILNPSNDFSSFSYIENEHKVTNELKTIFETLKYYFLEEGDCPSNTTVHAFASVTPQSQDGTICFSIERLTTLEMPIFSVEQQIAGLWFHELAHMNGFNENDAKDLQNLMLASYSYINPNFYDSGSRMFRLALPDKMNLPVDWGYFKELPPPPEGELYVPPGPKIPLKTDHYYLYYLTIGARLSNQNKMTEDFIRDFGGSIKLCESMDDYDSTKLLERYNQITIGYKLNLQRWYNENLLSDKSFVLRTLVYNSLLGRTKNFLCQANEKKICSDIHHRYIMLKTLVSEIQDDFANFLEYQWKFIDEYNLRISKSKSGISSSIMQNFLLPNFYSNSLIAHKYLIGIKEKFQKLKRIIDLDTNNCVKFWRNDIYQIDKLATVNELENEFWKKIKSPLNIYYSDGNLESLSHFIENIEDTPQFKKKVEHFVLENYQLFESLTLFDKIKENLEIQIQKEYDAFEILEQLYIARPLGDFEF